MRKTAVLNVVGLTPALLGEHTPFLAAWAARGQTATIAAVTPALTCSAQATYLTGVLPERHGIVGNGWYFRDECEVKFWRQSNHLVQATKVWETAREAEPGFTCANLFWWYNMYSSADWTVTPRPMYPADGRKVSDIYTQPGGLRDTLNRELGQFPLFDFWGPKTSIRSSEWIAAATKRIVAERAPTLTLVYVPHLDYALQRHGPDVGAVQRDLREVDRVCADLIGFLENLGVAPIVLSEYGITPVRRPIHPNRLLRERGLLAVREELGRELLDAGASAAFAVADHQVAHVYVNDPDRLPDVRRVLEAAEGVESVLEGEAKRLAGLDHPRAGDLVAIACADAWFTYYYWMDDRCAPDFARTVDIHRKPGYDPAELFIDPSIRTPALKAGWTLLKKQLGFRYMMELIPLDATLVRGSHGRPTDDPADGPLLITQSAGLLETPQIAAAEVCGVILKQLAG
ncbi:MAG TPA: alkaline phosphatase family protein [Chthonomonadaceae bacterium]|nr:alkaline phosphatase family protein [Chthonomonadaceae bacterium]